MKIDLLTLTKEGIAGLLNLVYPPICSICNSKLFAEKEIAYSVCSECLTKIKKNPPPYCKKCGRSLSGSTDNVETCWECFERKFFYERSWSGFLYEGITKEALHLFKYSHKFALSNLLSGLLTEFIRATAEILEGIDGVAAVPLYSVKLREREFNQSDILKEAVLKEFGIEDFSKCLKRTVSTRPQSELDKEERRENVKGVFETRHPELIYKKNLLLVDDLFTTGATLNECARVLKKSGAGRIHCLTFARGL